MPPPARSNGASRSTARCAPRPRCAAARCSPSRWTTRPTPSRRPRGRELWTHSGIVETANLLGGAAPAVDSGIVVSPYSSGELVAMRVETGRVLWSDSLTAVRRTDVVSSLAHIRGRPIIDRGRVIAISHGGAMAAVDLRSGQRLWEKDIGGQESPLDCRRLCVRHHQRERTGLPVTQQRRRVLGHPSCLASRTKTTRKIRSCGRDRSWSAIA